MKGMVGRWDLDVVNENFIESCVGKGWVPLCMELVEKLKEVCPECQVAQVKEKFGGLRFYIDNANKKAIDLGLEYENKSFKICETCGRKGKPRQELEWVKTLCEEHFQNKILVMAGEHGKRVDVKQMKGDKE